MPTPRPALRLDTTGQFLGGPLVGPHDNRRATRRAVSDQLASLMSVTGH